MNVWLAIMKVKGDAGRINWLDIVAEKDDGAMVLLLVVTAFVGGDNMELEAPDSAKY